MPRRNKRAGRPQSRRTIGKGSVPPIEDAIIPKGRCYLRHHKLQFTETEAPEALKQAQAVRKARGQMAYMEIRHYECLPGCGYHHLTSREERKKA